MKPSRASLRHYFRDLAIRRKLILLLLLSSTLGLALAGTLLIGYAWTSARATAERNLEAIAGIVADNSTAALIFGDTAAAGQTLSALKAKPEIESACLYLDQAGGAMELFARYPAGGSASCPAQAGAPGVRDEITHLAIVVPVVQAGDRIGWLLVRKNLRPLQQALWVQVVITLAMLGAAFAVSLAFGWLMQRVLVKPVLRLAQVARRVSQTRDYTQRADKVAYDEVGQLTDDFNLMLEQVGLREQQIEAARDQLAQQVHEKTAANRELQQALERLKQAQVQLVQSERLASLGGLVAGVAHEINTPVGVGVTAASTLADRAANIHGLYAADMLTRSDLERFLAVAQESSQIILKNLQRAADLIQSFKQVAVDQSSGERRLFKLHAYIDEILLSLMPRLRKSGHTVQVDCPPELDADSYPGALAQILTNFVNNSLLHAYAPGQSGRLRIDVREDGGWITLRYSDDGRGIAADHLARIYDPFFTTKRGQGGSGLGLHIVFNLVTQLLAGTIQARSEAGRGTEFLIRFPRLRHRVAA